jgi:uncharacterized protein YdeI (YjbR/CyaY-like superfamily)
VSGHAFNEAPQVGPRRRAEWRRWLQRNHAVSSGVWLVYLKKSSGLPGPTYDEAVEEALCFGWIDSRVRPLDGQRRLRWFSPRRPGSIWSALNKARVARLLESGLMAPAGLAKIEAAKADGSWDILDKVESMEIPDDLAAALAGAPGAAAGFAALAPSVQKPCLYWVLSAKRAATREVRVAAAVDAAAAGRSPLVPPPV